MIERQDCVYLPMEFELLAEEQPNYEAVERVMNRGEDASLESAPRAGIDEQEGKAYQEHVDGLKDLDTFFVISPLGILLSEVVDGHSGCHINLEHANICRDEQERRHLGD